MKKMLKKLYYILSGERRTRRLVYWANCKYRVDNPRYNRCVGCGDFSRTVFVGPGARSIDGYNRSYTSHIIPVYIDGRLRATPSYGHCVVYNKLIYYMCPTCVLFWMDLAMSHYIKEILGKDIFGELHLLPQDVKK
jgi:hypothetical protein